MDQAIGTYDQKYSDYMENGLAIARKLEKIFSALRPSGKGCDFRPAHGSEKICGGVMFRQPPPEFFVDLGRREPVDENGPIEFRVVYGGQEKCWEGIAAVMQIRVEFTVNPPAKPHGATWSISFTLPQDWIKKW